MATRCTAKQLAEAVAIWSTRDVYDPVMCLEQEEVYNLKPLDLFLSTMGVVKVGFIRYFRRKSEDYETPPMPSKQTFIDYLKPRCLLLSQNNKCFNLLLTCAYVSIELEKFVDCKCFHFTRIGCKVLTAVLENKFAEIFTSDSNWEELMSYCRKMHVAVLPSKENRPPEDESNAEDSEDEYSPNIYTEFYKDAETNQVMTKTRRLKVKHTPEYIDSLTEDDLIGYDESYRDFHSLEGSEIRERITESPQHLEEIIDLLKVFEEKSDPGHIYPEEHDIPISDDEDIEKLEKIIIPKPEYDLWALLLSEKELEERKKEICKKKNEELGDDSEIRVRPEDITDEDIFYDFRKVFDEDYTAWCELCKDKLLSFQIKCVEIFCEKYANCNLLSEKIDPNNDNLFFGKRSLASKQKLLKSRFIS